MNRTKDTLYPDINSSPDQYAVTETQFTQSMWGGWSILDPLRDRLAPYNTIRLNAGEHDLLGVGMPATNVLNGDAAETPVTVIEAKDHNTDPSDTDVVRGLTQAHAHLPKSISATSPHRLPVSPTRHAHRPGTSISGSSPSKILKRHTSLSPLASLGPVRGPISTQPRGFAD